MIYFFAILLFLSTGSSAIIDRAPHLHNLSHTIWSEEEMPAKYIFVTGGVVSSLGKGLAAAFEQATDAGGRDSLPQRGNHAAGDKYIFGHYSVTTFFS